MPKIIVAIDGFAACGKSTLARSLAHALGYVYIDSGAMYRAVTLYLLEQNISFDDTARISKALEQDIVIRFRRVGDRTHTFLNNHDVETDIRTMRVSGSVSEVAALREVRTAMVQQQQAMGTMRGMVMDGRDIGTVVFPDAELKLFMTASVEVRVARRKAELLAKRDEAIDDDIRANLLKRDDIDTHRVVTPMHRTPDAVELDNTSMTPEAQHALALHFALSRIDAKARFTV